MPTAAAISGQNTDLLRPSAQAVAAAAGVSSASAQTPGYTSQDALVSFAEELAYAMKHPGGQIRLKAAAESRLGLGASGTGIPSGGAGDTRLDLLV